MRKLIESTLVSADGVIGDPPAWAMEYRDEEVQADALERLSGSDTLLMGRGTYELFAAIWPGQEDSFADRMNSIRKYVFSATLEKADWNNTTIVRGDPVTEVTKLKEQDGQDLAIFGHGLLAQTLLEHGLTDQLRLAVHPVLAGNGKLLFRPSGKTPLRLTAVKSFSSGVVVLHYQPALLPHSGSKPSGDARRQTVRPGSATRRRRPDEHDPGRTRLGRPGALGPAAKPAGRRRGALAE